tara:strand:+ start:73 stop:474 length:402 start_codon:yes stop_codon:yes gene_type:complete
MKTSFYSILNALNDPNAYLFNDDLVSEQDKVRGDKKYTCFEALTRLCKSSKSFVREMKEFQVSFDEEGILFNSLDDISHLMRFKLTEVSCYDLDWNIQTYKEDWNDMCEALIEYNEGRNPNITNEEIIDKLEG